MVEVGSAMLRLLLALLNDVLEARRLMDVHLRDSNVTAMIFTERRAPQAHLLEPLVP